MIKFIKKLLIFIFPLLLIMSFPYSVLLLSGELLSVDRIIKIQKENKNLVIYGTAYWSPIFYYTYKSFFIREGVDVISLGTSRTYQFRSLFFKNNVEFYNAGGAVAEIAHLRYFLNMITKGHEPKIIILGLDHNFFNSRWDNSFNVDLDKELLTEFDTMNILKTSWKKVYLDYFKGKYQLSNLFANEDDVKRVGLLAVSSNEGFRNDGSYCYGRYINDPLYRKNRDYQFKDTFERISKGIKRFEYGDSVSLNAMNELRYFLKTCKERGIYVIAFLPPYAHAVNIKLKSMDDKYGYMFRIEKEIRPILNEYHFGFHNFSDLVLIGASDDEFFDGSHGSEKAYLRLFIKMAETDRVLKQYVDLSFLKRRLDASVSDYDVFKNEF